MTFQKWQHGNRLVCFGHSLPARSPPLAWSCIPLLGFPSSASQTLAGPGIGWAWLDLPHCHKVRRKHEWALLRTLTFFTWPWSDNLNSAGLWKNRLEPRLPVCQILDAELFLALPCLCRLLLEFGGGLCFSAPLVTLWGWRDVVASCRSLCCHSC